MLLVVEEGSQAAEELGRVAGVAGEYSCLDCAGQPPAQRDAGYPSEGCLSIKIVLPRQGGVSAGRVRGTSALSSEPVVAAYAPVVREHAKLTSVARRDAELPR